MPHKVYNEENKCSASAYTAEETDAKFQRKVIIQEGEFTEPADWEDGDIAIVVE